MQAGVYDLIIVGGGLSGSLLLHALSNQKPELKILLFEKNQTLGGNHTWCLHEHDLPQDCASWVRPLISKTWDSYDVLFPKYSRTLHSAYHCIRSADLHKKTIEKYSDKVLLGTDVNEWKKTEDGTFLVNNTYFARAVIDARGWIADFKKENTAWQKFVGLELQLKEPHNLSRVRLKDVRIPQVDGYRFVYVLPFHEKELLVEDTYYSNEPYLNQKQLESNILDYCLDQGWQVEKILRKEVGCLPLALRHDPQLQANQESIGAASLHCHPVTGYTLPQTLQLIRGILKIEDFTFPKLTESLAITKKQLTHEDRYFYLLNRMMFMAAKPQKRYQILERFYQLDEHLIQRFYSGKPSTFDKMRILAGKPPVPLLKAIKAVLN